jgi:hypothetical protein
MPVAHVIASISTKELRKSKNIMGKFQMEFVSIINRHKEKTWIF